MVIMNRNRPAMRAQMSGSTSIRSTLKANCGANSRGTMNSMFSNMPNQVTQRYQRARRSYACISVPSPTEIALQPLHVLHQGGFIFRGQHRAIEMATVLIARNTGIELEQGIP